MLAPCSSVLVSAVPTRPPAFKTLRLSENRLEIEGGVCSFSKWPFWLIIVPRAGRRPGRAPCRGSGPGWPPDRAEAGWQEPRELGCPGPPVGGDGGHSGCTWILQSRPRRCSDYLRPSPAGMSCHGLISCVGIFATTVPDSRPPWPRGSGAGCGWPSSGADSHEYAGAGEELASQWCGLLEPDSPRGQEPALHGGTSGQLAPQCGKSSPRQAGPFPAPAPLSPWAARHVGQFRRGWPSSETPVPVGWGSHSWLPS